MNGHKSNTFDYLFARFATPPYHNHYLFINFNIPTKITTFFQGFQHFLAIIIISGVHLLCNHDIAGACTTRKATANKKEGRDMRRPRFAACWVLNLIAYAVGVCPPITKGRFRKLLCFAAFMCSTMRSKAKTRSGCCLSMQL